MSHFTISQRLMVKGADGEPEREYESVGGRYAARAEALLVVAAKPDGYFFIDEHPRPKDAMFPAFAGTPEKAREELRKDILAA